MGTKSAWTPERRKRQAEIIRQTRPWASATGPKTDAGKAITSLNAIKNPFEKRARIAEAEGEAIFKQMFDMVGAKTDAGFRRSPK